jgi:hypothetical protein
MELKKGREDRLKKIIKMLEGKMFVMYRAIGDLERELVEIRRKKVLEGSKKPNLFEEFCTSMGVEVISKETCVRANNIQRRMALNVYGRRPTFSFNDDLADLKRLRQERERARKEQNDEVMHAEF